MQTMTSRHQTNLSDKVDDDKMEDDVTEDEVGESTLGTDASKVFFIRRIDLINVKQRISWLCMFEIENGGQGVEER